MILTLKTLINPVLKTDSYKLSHKAMTPNGTTKIYSYFSARFNKYLKQVVPCEDNKVVFFGLQSFLIDLKNDWNEGFFFRDKEEVMNEIKYILTPYLGMQEQHLEHFSNLYDLGYLPIQIKALPEGTVTDLQVPLLTITNTHKDFAWLTNYLETVLSAEMWKPITVATIAREMAKVRDEAWDKTVTDHTFKQFALHDFSYRGHSGTASSAICGASHLLYSNGTDNVPGVVLARTKYHAKEDTAISVSAAEHSVSTLSINLYQDESKYSPELSVLASKLKKVLEDNGIGNEYKQAVGELATLYNLLVNIYPSGIFSYVADSYDYWRVLYYILPILKDIILARDGKFVIRPDSNDPVEMVCGTRVNVIQCYSLLDAMQYALNGDIICLDDEYYKVLNEEAIDDTLAYDNLSTKEAVALNYLEYLSAYRTNPEYKGSVKILSYIFGSTTNSKGYKELHPKIGLIYGDGINYHRASTIYNELEKQGFAASNVIFGIGSFLYGSSSSRDSLGMAIKASYAVVDDKSISIAKDPKTDSNKKSLKGLLKVEQVNDKFITVVNVTEEQEKSGLLQTVFYNSSLTNPVEFKSIKERANI